MKKLIIAAFAIASAAVVQAAAVNWASDYNYVTSAGAIQTSATADKGTFVLVYLGNDADKINWSSATVVNEGTVVYGSGKSGSYARAGGSYSFTYGAEGSPSNGDIFGVMFKDEDGKLNQLEYVGGTKVTETFTISGMGNNTYAGAFTYATGNYTTVPEPTSGLMLVLGIAGLALKRKRA
ncbi:MAG: PEP-CTERM sorting domain-containing protein [Kiritimatiellae bacterium]|nr:PEP-CTERM sorting domain-containing protein [Kiritimatiellia bacterium]